MKIAFYKVKENDKSTFLDKAIAFFYFILERKIKWRFFKFLFSL